MSTVPYNRAREVSAPSRRRTLRWNFQRKGLRAATAGALALGVAPLVPGCGTVHMDGTFRMEGPLLLTKGSYISDTMFDSLEEGSHKSWAIAIFGEPDQRTTLDDGSEVWRWTFSETHMSVGLNPSLLNLGGDSDKKKGKGDGEAGSSPTDATAVVFTNTYVRIVKDHVESKWRG